MVDRTAPLPQLSGRVFLTDAGLETDLIFNHGVEIRGFAAHTLLPIPADREKMAAYFRGYLRLAQELGTGYILDAPTWKAHPHWAAPALHPPPEEPHRTGPLRGPRRGKSGRAREPVCRDQ